VAQQGLELRFRNSGPSLSAEEVKVMLQPLDSQGHDSDIGAGMQHVRQIIEAHNGSFAYDPNRGFVVFLPYYTGNNAQTRDEAARA
jgi:nitrogen-specific signal transduction histidine kinase